MHLFDFAVASSEQSQQFVQPGTGDDGRVSRRLPVEEHAFCDLGLVVVDRQCIECIDVIRDVAYVYRDHVE